jgi:hypothetical protein
MMFDLWIGGIYNHRNPILSITPTPDSRPRIEKVSRPTLVSLWAGQTASAMLPPGKPLPFIKSMLEVLPILGDCYVSLIQTRLQGLSGAVVGSSMSTGARSHRSFLNRIKSIPSLSNFPYLKQRQSASGLTGDF